MQQTPTKTDSPKIAGLLAEFDGPAALVAAAASVREAGYVRIEAYSPLPVHGIDAALGRRRTCLPWLVLLGGFGGLAGALLLQWWTNAIDYPYIISGKPPFSLPASIPIAFELIILFAALAAFGGGLALCGLPELFHPLFACEPFRRATTDAFFLTIEEADPRFDAEATAELLRSLGGRNAEVYGWPESTGKLPAIIPGVILVALALALLPPLWIAKNRFTKSSIPRVHLVKDMDFQPKYLSQQASPLFDDGRAMRPPVEGTVAIGQLVDNSHLRLGGVEGDPATTFPMPATERLVQRGRQRYDIYCATCHGLAGDGDGMTSQMAFELEEPKWVRPLALHSQAVREQEVGELFQTISNGVRTMPSYASQIPVEDRWAIVLYVRALQRSRHATMKDVPSEKRRHLEPIDKNDAETRND